jgi:hypothetical protein
LREQVLAHAPVQLDVELLGGMSASTARAAGA